MFLPTVPTSTYVSQKRNCQLTIKIYHIYIYHYAI